MSKFSNGFPVNSSGEIIVSSGASSGSIAGTLALDMIPVDEITGGLKLNGIQQIVIESEATTVKYGENYLELLVPSGGDHEIQMAQQWLSDRVENGCIKLSNGVTYTLSQGLNLNLARTSLVCNRNVFDASSLTTGSAITLDYVYAGAAGYQKYNGRTSSISGGLRIQGPGKATSGVNAIYVNGTQTTPTSNGVRPTLNNLFIHGFSQGLVLNNRAYLGSLNYSDIYDCNVAIRQMSGVDSGEGMKMVGGSIFQSNLMLWMEDDSSEWTFDAVSFDYSNQLLLLTNTGRMFFNKCHFENRGADAGDNVYIVQGTGSDSRAVVSTKDSFIDIDGNGSLVVFDSGSFDVNNLGGLGPYSYDHLINVRHKNAVCYIDKQYWSNAANTTNKVAVGQGMTIPYSIQTKAIHGMPTRFSDQAHNNCLSDGGFEDANGFEDLWSVSKDTAAVTSRTTGTNISISRSTAQHYAGSASMKVTKVGAGSGQVSVYIPIRSGCRRSAVGRVYRPSSGGMTGSIFGDLRWCSMASVDGNGVPVALKVGAYFSSCTMSATTDSWQQFTMSLFDNGTSGEPMAPSWATHLKLTINCDSGSAGDLYLDDMFVSPW